MDYSKIARELSARGTVLLEMNQIFTSEELNSLDELLGLIPEEKVDNGDSGDIHDLFVRRIVTDKSGEIPKKVNQPVSDKIMEILEDEKRRIIFNKIFGSSRQYFIRRCQVNRMIKESFIGLHLDAASNPKYEYSVIILLSHDFDGGEFVVYPENLEPQVYTPTYGSVLITTCKFSHEVRKVLANERKSLVYFYSDFEGINPLIVPES